MMSLKTPSAKPRPSASLDELITAHQKYSHLTPLAQALGDGYLYAHNPIFRNVREVFLGLGFTYTSERFEEYDTLKLVALPKILKQKTVPYQDNFSPVLTIARRHPRQFAFSDLPHLRMNATLHESCHCLADQVLGSPLEPGSTVRERQSQALLILLAESYANTAELVGNVHVENQVHEAFYQANSYMPGDESTRERLRASFDFLGPLDTIRLVLMGYLFANFLREEGELQELDVVVILRMLGIASKPGPRELESLHKLFSTSFQLNPGFRMKATPFYFKNLGFPDEIHELLNFNFLKRVRDEAALQDAISTLADLLHNGIRARWFHSVKRS